MMDERLVSYIKICLEQGKPQNEIVQELQLKGWPLDVINKAISSLIPNQQLCASGGRVVIAVSPINTNNMQTELKTEQNYKETTRIKIVALIFFTGGVLGILASIGSFGSIIFGQSFFGNSSILIINLIYKGFLGLTIGYLTYISFRISKTLHHLEIQGYQSAIIHLVTITVSSILYDIYEVFILQQPGVFILIPLSLLPGLLIYLLYSHKQLFINSSINSLKIMTIICEVLLFSVYLLGIFVQNYSINHINELQIKTLENYENSITLPTRVPTSSPTPGKIVINFKWKISEQEMKNYLKSIGTKSCENKWPNNTWSFLCIVPIGKEDEILNIAKSNQNVDSVYRWFGE
jgi:hypothetical protein